MAGTSQATVAVATPAFAKRQARALIGWLTEEEGALWLAGRDMQGATNAALLDRARRARQTAAARPAVPNQQGITSPLPEALATHLAALAAHPWSTRVLADIGQPMMVDLTRVRAMQPMVRIDDARKRVDGINPNDMAAIAAITIPVPPAEPPPIEAIFDPTKQAHILASPSPNLKVLGPLPTPAKIEIGPGVQVPAFGFAVALLPSFVNVAGIGGRYFLLDGYHRAYGLLAAGITRVPGLVKNYGQLQECRISPGMLSPDVFLGDHAPLLPDYLDDTVCADTMAPVVTKMIVIQALEVTPLG